MPRRVATARRPQIIPVLALLALAALALFPLSGLTGCERAPEPPVWDNPFDPTGPEAGDPLNLRVMMSSGQVTLIWAQPQGMGIVQYAISHSEQPDTGWSSLALVDATSSPEYLYAVTAPTPTQTNWYRVQAVGADGLASLVDYATPAGVQLGPRVILNDNATFVASRQVTMKVLVSQGTTLRVALGPDYATETTYPAAAPGDTAVITFDAGAAAQGDSVRVRVIATDGAFTSVATIAKARIDFSPDFTLLRGGTVVASRADTLRIPPAGVTQMRFATSEAGLAGATWVPGSSRYSAPLLEGRTGSQQIWGEFEGDFGFNSVSHITVTPDLLTAATFRLAVPEDHVTTTAFLRGVLGGQATLVRWAEGPNLAGAAWVARPDTLDIELSAGEGLKTIYLQMRNDWADSPILTDYAVFVSRGVEVAFVAPTNGVVVQGGDSLQVRGTAFGGGAALGLVEVDLGNDFTAASGLASWTKWWEVPTVTADSVVTLRARATAGAGETLATATTTISVTITPPVR